MIRVYTMPTCPPCHTLLEWLDQQGIEYEEISAKSNPYIEMTPTAEIDGKFVVGLDEIKHALQNG